METNMCKKRSWYGIMVFFSIVFLISNIENSIVHAQSQEGNVPVTYIKEKSDAYLLSISVKGFGELVIGNDILRDKKETYMLPVDESKTLEFRADVGAVIRTVILNGKDVTQEIKNNRLMIQSLEKKQTIKVEFQKNINASIFPVTRDFSNHDLYFMIFILSLGVFIYYSYKKICK